MLNEYTVWIVAPQGEGGLFRLCIHPRLPLNPDSRNVAQTLLTRLELKSLLIQSLPDGQNSFGTVEAMITGAEEHVSDLKMRGAFLLSDEQARGLGWSFSGQAQSPRTWNKTIARHL